MLAALLIAAAAFLYARSVLPTVRELVYVTVTNRASQAINDSVRRLLAENAQDCANLAVLQRDVKGNVTAVETDVSRANRLRTEVLDAVDREIREISVSKLGVPMGSVVMPALLSGVGPMLPVKILAVSSSDAAFESSFEAVGINQTLHRIVLKIRITMTVLSPAGTTEIDTDADMIAAETVIVGVVPETYLGEWKQNERKQVPAWTHRSGSKS